MQLAAGGAEGGCKQVRRLQGADPGTLTPPGAKRVRTVRVRGGHLKWRALRLDHGNFSWGSEAISRRTRVLDVPPKLPIHPYPFCRKKSVTPSAMDSRQMNLQP